MTNRVSYIIKTIIEVSILKRLVEKQWYQGQLKLG